MDEQAAGAARDDSAPTRGPRRPGQGALLAVGALLALGLCVCGALIYGQLVLGSPEATARGFMDALTRRDYPGAYSWLSSAGRSSWVSAGSEGAELNFTRYVAALDRRYGMIQRYMLGPAHVQGTRATLEIVVVRPGAPEEVDRLALSRQGASWAIDAYVPGVAP